MRFVARSAKWPNLRHAWKLACRSQNVWQDWPRKLAIKANVRSINATHVIATWDRVLIQLWRGEVTLGDAEKLLVLGREFIATSRGAHPLNILTIIESRSPAPSQRVRTTLSACFAEFGKTTQQQFFVSEGSGFRAALIRGVGLTVSTLAPSLLPFKFATSLDEVAVAIGPHISAAAGGAEGLKRAVAELRQLLDQQSVPS
jgi:hypothetical protein